MVTLMIYLLVMSEAVAGMIGGFATFLTGAAIISLLAAVFFTLTGCSEDGFDRFLAKPDEENGDSGGFWYGSTGLTLIKWWKRIVFAAILCHIISPMIPDQKNMAMIVAGSATYHAVTSEPAQRIGGKALDLLDKKLDEAMGEVHNGGNKGKEEE